jgi:hypothetical protein
MLLLLLAIASGLAPAAVQGQSCESYAETAKFVGTFRAIPSPELVESGGAPLPSGEYLLRLDADRGSVVRAAKVTMLR